MSDIDHRSKEFEELAPWFAAGLLSPEETARFEAALAQDGRLRANVEAARAELAATIEDVDIRDLLGMAANPAVDNQDVVAVFGELTKASRNHMRAFTSRLESLGLTYAPQYITPEYYESIVTTDWEKGGSICGPCPGQGLGNGNGQGNGGNCPYGNNSNGGNCPYGNNGSGGSGSGHAGDCPYGNPGNGGGDGGGRGGNGGGNGGGGNGG